MCCLLENRSRIPKYTCHICHAFCIPSGTKSTEFFFHSIWEEIPSACLEYSVYKWDLSAPAAPLSEWAVRAHPGRIWACPRPPQLRHPNQQWQPSARGHPQEGFTDFHPVFVQSGQGISKCSTVFLWFWEQLLYKASLAETSPSLIFTELAVKKHKAENFSYSHKNYLLQKLTTNQSYSLSKQITVLAGNR